MNKIKSAYEGIMFQASSSLGRDLTALFNKVFVYRDSLDYEGIPDSKKANFRRAQVFSYVKSNIFPELIKIVKNNTNLTLKKVVAVNQFQGLFAIDLSMDNINDAITVLSHQSGTTVFEQDDYISKSAKEMQKMSTMFDPKTGRLIDSKYKTADGKERQIFGTLYFDISFAFLMYDNFPKGAAEELTGAELAAIVMHEVGHVLTMVERASDNYLVIERMNDTCARLSKYTKSKGENVTQDDIREVSKALTESVIPTLCDKNNTFSSVFSIDPNVLKATLIKFNNALNNMAGIDSLDYNNDNSTAFRILCAVIYRIFTTCMLGFLKIVALSAVYNCFSCTDKLLNFIFHWSRYSINRITSPEKNVQVGKTSDVADSTLNFVNIERMADEFVSRHGYSSQIASGLKKMHDVFSVLDTGSATTVGGSIAYGRFVKCMAALSSFIGISGSVYTGIFAKIFGVSFIDTYENEVNRTKRLLQNTKAAFKRGMVDPEDLTAYIIDYEKTLAVLDTQKSLLRNSKIPMQVKKILGSAAYITRILSGFMMPPDLSGKLAIVETLHSLDLRKLTELRGLNNDLAELINNDFYYYAAKFKTLAR